MGRGQQQRIVVRRPRPAPCDCEHAWQCTGTVRVEYQINHGSDTKSREPRIIESLRMPEHGQPDEVGPARDRREAVVPVRAASVAPAQIGARPRGRATGNTLRASPKLVERPLARQALCEPRRQSAPGQYVRETQSRESELDECAERIGKKWSLGDLDGDRYRGRHAFETEALEIELAKDTRGAQRLDVVGHGTKIEHTECRRQSPRRYRGGHRGS